MKQRTKKRRNNTVEQKCVFNYGLNARRSARMGVSMKHFRLTGMIACIVGIICCMSASVLYGKLHKEETYNSYEEPLQAAPKDAGGNPTEEIEEDFTVSHSFASHLPIVVLEWEEEPPITARMDNEQERFVDIEGVEPYVGGTLSIYQSESGTNSLSEQPVLESGMLIKRRGNSSMLYEKAQYTIKTVTESGQYRDVNVLGMGEEHEWILNGSMADKSMLRNYLAYSLASEILSYTPDTIYCEVLIKKDSVLTYQGVYLLGESIRQGVDRVNIQEYRSGSNFNSYLVRRDRLDDGGLMLDTYARTNNLAPEYFGLLYPSPKNADADMVSYVEADISRIERILYSEEEAVFSTYEEVIDVDSFVDYFLLNEFLGSYDSGNYSTYCYKDRGGKLTMGPVWDYDGTMDNYVHEPLDTDALAFQVKPWFAQLCRDNTFINKLEKRYAYLRRGVFSEEHVIGKIDEITAHLGGAINREWYRWGHIYAEDTDYNLDDYEMEDGTVLIRNASTYNDEIYRIKTALRKHGNQIPQQLEILHKSAVFTTGIMHRPGIWLMLSICIFTVPLYYIARHRG